MQIELNINDLKPYQVKANRKNKNPHGKQNPLSIYKTIQGKQKNEGINIDFRDEEFLNYANLNIYIVLGKLFFELTNKYNEDSYRISINRINSRVSQVKIGSKEAIRQIAPYEGEWELIRQNDKGAIIYCLGERIMEDEDG